MGPKLRASKRCAAVLVEENNEDSKSSVDGNSDNEETEIDECKESNAENGGKENSESEVDDDTGEIDNKLNYFVAVSQRTKRSKNTLHDIDLSCLQKMNDENYVVHLKERKQLLAKYETKLFPLWFNLMSERFNVILHGFGSKKGLLDNFIQLWLTDEYHCVIHGYFSELSLKTILNTLKEPLLVEKSDESTILSSAKKMKYDLYVIIHSLDSLLSTDKKAKAFLRELVIASAGRIHIIASVDHVNSGLLWSSQETHQLNWVWFHTPTFVSYSLERSFSNSSFNANANSAFSQYLTLSAVEHVYDSLTPNAQKIFLMIAKHYLKSNEKNDSDSDEEDTQKMNSSEGLTFATLYRNCREEFLVNSELTLRSQLTEFKDHKLVKSQKSSDGSEVVTLLVDLHLIRNFVSKIAE